MFKNFKLPALALGAALAITSPGAALARDHDRDDRDHERREWREHERHERRERIWTERAPGFGVYYGPSYAYDPYSYGYYSGPNYAGGYYDRWGRWHPYGFYDRWGRWHPY